MLAILFVDFELVMRCSPLRARVVIVVFFSIIQNVLKVKRLSKGEKVKGERVKKRKAQSPKTTRFATNLFLQEFVNPPTRQLKPVFKPINP